jgi:aconitase A
LNALAPPKSDSTPALTQVQIPAATAILRPIVMPVESIDSIRETIDTPSGKAWAHNVLKMKDFGYDIEHLPYSIRVLLENAARHSGRVHGALEAAHSLASWPRTVDSETPFMPYRVLLQDYTGVPLVVDLAAMREAAKRSGVDTGSINSQVPVDLVIDHSIQVDSWGNDMAFAVNLEKEYERNSERYSLLKWAQSSFKNMRVFPPGKGICHQFNLEYLSKVVALSGDGGRLEAFPDTLVGTDSHTTMVNGLGCLGWGVGGIEAEAVMLGEPYHMPIPKVFGVKFTGNLKEGVTPTDLVLTVTQRLREKNVVGSFVEYFGEGYGQLSVPDRATIGNMSPEYGATAGFFPIDEATLAYLRGTARPKEHIELVERYAKQVGLFVSGIEPHYSEIIHIELDSIEPSIAGPHNPEERHLLRSVSSFAGTLLRGQRPEPPAGASAPLAPRSQLMLEEDGPIHTGFSDGSVVIAAITSCTNTSNPTVMVGAGLIAKKAVEAGLSLKPWVKPSLAPGSTVVTDYLRNGDLLRYLDKLGFVLVGYGCTTCIAEGTPVLLADGTARPIESFPAGGGAVVMGPTASGRLGITRQLELMSQGVRDCVELVMQDGRTLVCTPDHRILCSDGRWVRADELKLGEDRLVTGLDVPIDIPQSDEGGYVLHAGNMTFGMQTERDRARTLAFARLLGHLLNDGSISVQGQGRMNAGQAIDRRTILNDIELLTGLRPAAKRYDERKWSIVLPMALTRALVALQGVQVGRRIDQAPTLPSFVLQENCPVGVVREFLGGLFGADGHAPRLHRWGGTEDESSLEPPAFSKATTPPYLEESKEMMLKIVLLLAKCGVKTEGARVYDYPTRRSRSTYGAAKDGIARLEVRLNLPDGLSFVQRVGFRYSVDKQMRASAAAAYWRLVEGIQGQRLWMADRIKELHQEQPLLSFSRARQAVATSMVSHPVDESLAPVVSPRYALLEGYDRFSRLPKTTDRRFRPLHGKSNGFPTPVKFLKELGVREWFSSLQRRAKSSPRKYCVEKEAETLPTLSLRVVDRRPAGQRQVYDLAVDDLHSFVAGTIAVHNCIGNSGPLSPDIEKEIKEKDIYSVAVLSGNRNFDGRIHPLVKGAFLMSPMLVVCFALAGRIDFDFAASPFGKGRDGKLVYMKDLWPTLGEIKKTVQSSLSPELYSRRYADAMKGDDRWEKLASFRDDVYHWEDKSTYIRNPPWFEPPSTESAKKDIRGARVLAVFEDKVTTDHISPAGTIPVDSPAGAYLTEHGVDLIHFSTYGSRRGNHEVMIRGGFSNIRLRNGLAKGREGGYTSHFPDGSVASIYDAAMKYQGENVPLVVLAGRQYGAGSSRDWAAKAPKLLGVRAVLAETFERIHRSNLVAMGVVPLQFKDGEGAKRLGLTGEESVDITGLEAMQSPKEWVDVVARGAKVEKRFKALVRVDNSTEMEYLRAGGVLPYVFEKLRKSAH